MKRDPIIKPKTEPSGIEATVCADIAERQRLGIAKYGKTVADNPLSLRAWLQHEYEELLDACVYMRRAIAEIDAKAEKARKARKASLAARLHRQRLAGQSLVVE